MILLHLPDEVIWKQYFSITMKRLVSHESWIMNRTVGHTKKTYYHVPAKNDLVDRFWLEHDIIFLDHSEL